MSPSLLISCLFGIAGSSIVETTRKYFRDIACLSQRSTVIFECLGHAVVTRDISKEKTRNTFRISVEDCTETTVF